MKELKKSFLNNILNFRHLKMENFYNLDTICQIFDTYAEVIFLFLNISIENNFSVQIWLVSQKYLIENVVNIIILSFLNVMLN